MSTTSTTSNSLESPLLFQSDAFPGSDFIITSRDGIQFKVHRVILGVASPVWRDMFSIQQAQHTPERPDSIPENNIVLVEDSWTINALLSLIYPIDYEAPDTMPLGKLTDLLAVAHKYQTDFAAKRIEKVLLSRAMLGAPEALQVYAIGSAFDNERLIKEGGKGCLKASAAELFDMKDEGVTTNHTEGLEGNAQAGSPVTETDEKQLSIINILRLMNGWDCHRLHMLHRQRSQDAKAIVSSLRDGPVRFSYSPYNNFGGNCNCCSTDICERYIQLALAELDASGATSERIFSTDFLASCVQRDCERCCRTLFVENSEAFAQLKQKIDALPDSV